LSKKTRPGTSKKSTRLEKFEDETGFHTPLFRDVDLVICSMEELLELRATLTELFKEDSLRNEYDDWTPLDLPAHWNFKHLSKEDYGWHQRRKRIYAVHDAELLGREGKIEFEPVRRWDEITNEYPETLSIRELGRVEAVREVVSGDEGGFMLSIYPVRLEDVETRNGSFHQIALSYGRDYFYKVLKLALSEKI